MLFSSWLFMSTSMLAERLIPTVTLTL
uniref:Uncharacterized protein n=1 Tax=Rhizophora mucronata TaxID=61149 RepID=A0A2P2QDI1_RHIMU